MNILQISVRADTGGGPQHIWSLLQGFSGDVKAFIACPKEAPYWQRFKDSSSVEKMVSIPHRKFTFKDFFKLVKFVQQNNIDLIHSHGKGGGVYSRLLGLYTRLKVVHTFHGVHTGDYGFVKLFFYRFYERFMSFCTDKIIFVSESEKRQALSQSLVPEKLTLVICNGIDASLAEQIICKPLLNEPDEKILTIVNVNRFNRQKNPWLLLSIYEELIKRCEVPFRFIILGDGGWKEQFIEKINSMNIASDFILPGSVDEPLAWFQLADIFLSTALWEGLPLAPLEAMSCSLPLVLSNVTGNSEVITEGENGFLFESENVVEATDCILKLVNDLDKRVKMGQKGLSLVKTRFSSQHMIKETVRLYFELSGCMGQQE